VPKIGPARATVDAIDILQMGNGAVFDSADCLQLASRPAHLTKADMKRSTRPLRLLHYQNLRTRADRLCCTGHPGRPSTDNNDFHPIHHISRLLAT
jgi:hypothetical protein